MTPKPEPGRDSRPVLPVALTRMLEYESTLMGKAVGLLLDEIGCAPARGSTVLVKPNLVGPRQCDLSCTHPLVVRAACSNLLDRGARVLVGDSPAFGTAKSVARMAGYPRALKGLDVEIVNFDKPVQVPLSFGKTTGVARVALEADMILNLPRLKAHNQMRLTAGVKNLFGCVVGFRKAVAHARYPDPERFCSLILDTMAALPPAFTILDAVHAMHQKGPTGGRPHNTGFLAACADPVALDTAVYAMLGLTPAKVPLWSQSVKRNLPYTHPDELAYPLERPKAFDLSGFAIPETLSPIEFRPLRLTRGRLKSLFARYR